MARVKRGIIKAKKRRNILKQVKGYRFGRSKKKRQAKEAIAHAGVHAFTHRKDKKGDFRRLWTVRINAAVRGLDMPESKNALSYSKFINALKNKDIGINRKMLSTIAKDHPETFKKIVKEVQ